MWPSSGRQNTKHEGIKEYKMILQEYQKQSTHVK